MARGRKRRGGAEEEAGDSILDRIERALERAPAGLHDVGEPAGAVPLDWPASVAELYLTFDGLRLFHDAIELWPAAQVVGADPSAGAARRWRVGTAWGDPVWVDATGRVWRAEGAGADADLDAQAEAIVDGTTLARWVSGALDAEALIYDADGEFVEDVFDEEGELVPAIEEARLRARVRRDPRAPGPRWSLARHLVRGADDEPGRLGEARDLLEEVVADGPDLAWAWLDLARISERVGELDGAIDEAAAAAEAAARTGSGQVAFFWAHAARLAAARGDDARRAELAARARAADPRVVDELVAGATDNLGAGDRDAAATMLALARAVAPKDLRVLDLATRVEGN